MMRKQRRRWVSGLMLGLSFLAACSADDEQQDPTDPELRTEPDVVGRWPQNVPAGFVLHDLGVVTTQDGFTEPLPFEVDAQTRALHVVAISHPETFVLMMHAQAPDGSDWVSPDPPQPMSPEADSYFGGFPGPATSPNMVVPRPRAAAALLPNTPALAMQPGPWSFRLGVYRLHYDEQADRYDNEPLDAAVRVGVLERTVAPLAQGRLDLTLTFASDSANGTSAGAGGGDQLTAATAPHDATVQQALSFIDTSLRPVGIELGEVTYQDGPTVEGYVDLGGPSCLGGADLERAFDAAPEPRPGSLQVLFIESFLCETSAGEIGPLFAGISNGLPGLPFATRDGLVISTRVMGMAPDIAQKMLAHEIGHYLGLFHTCEGEIGTCDHIADTPEGVDASANIMFPDASLVTDFVFTPQQGDVMRLSPLIQPLR